MTTSTKLFLAILEAAGVPRPVPEFRFDPKRRWRFDYAWLDQKVALEVEGGIFTAGRHTRGAGFLADMEKYNRAAVLGWRLLRVQPKGLYLRETVELVKGAISPPCE